MSYSMKHPFFYCASLFFFACFLYTVTASEVLFFEGDQAPTRWQGTGVETVRPQPDVFAEHHGLTLELPLDELANRAYWDATVSLDLKESNSFSFDVQIDNPDAIKSASIYFRSGDGWYGGWFTLEDNKWQNITLARADFSPEGSPAGWDQIDTVRIAFWKENDVHTTAQIANFRAHNVPILILRNTAARENKPDDADFANRLTDRLHAWLQQSGIPVTVTTDEDVKSAPPASGTKLIILPYNTVIPDEIHERLQRFTEEGGKILAAYALDAPLRDLLGLKRWEWLAADPSDAFAFMHFPDAEEYGLPERVTQNSWNINRPYPAEAQVLATWQNGQGEDSGIPAVTIGEHGVFLSHVLTNTGREAKIQMLHALIAKLIPDMVPQLSDTAISRATTILDHRNWESTKAYIQETAERHRRRRRVRLLLHAIDESIEELDASRHELSYAEMLRETQNIQKSIREAFYQSFSTRNAPPDEFRGVWAHHAEGVPGMPWDEIMQTLNTYGINNVFANVLWAGAAFYPSDVLPIKSPDEDYAQTILDAGKEHDVHTHAWIVLWSLQHAPDDFIEDMRRSERLQKNRENQELPWLCPSHPDNRDLTAQAAKEVMDRYPFHGFHIDYIRYPDRDACFCKGCRERFSSARNIDISEWPQEVTEGPLKEDWLAWRRNVIDTMMERLDETVRDVDTDAKISAAVWPGWPAVRDSIAQDWPNWAKEGWVDFFTPMSYTRSRTEAERFYRSHRQEVLDEIPIYPGIAPSTKNLSPPSMLQHIDTLRESGAPGFVLFDLDRDLLELHLPALGAGAIRP